MEGRTVRGARAFGVVGIGVLALVGSPGSGDAWGQESRTPVRVGEAEVFPSVRVEYVRDTNVFLTAEDEVASNGVAVRPEVEAVADRRLLDLRAAYRGDYASYSEDALDYADHRLEAGVVAELSTRQTLRGDVYLSREHERLGVNLTRGIAATLDEQVVYDRLGLDGSFTFGAASARGNLTGGLVVERRTFVTLDELTRGEDFSLVQPYGLFSYRLSPGSRGLVEFRYGRFVFGETDDDRNDLTALIGIALGADGKTGGSARIGATTSDYSLESRDAESSLALEIDLFYLPKPFARLQLQLDREVDNLGGVPGETDIVQAIETRAALIWTHQWSGRVSTRGVLQATDNDRGCPAVDTLRTAAGFELSLQVRRWLSFGVGAIATARDVTACEGEAEPQLDFVQQTYSAHVRATL